MPLTDTAIRNAKPEEQPYLTQNISLRKRANGSHKKAGTSEIHLGQI